MSTALRVSWQNNSPLEGGKCDFCSGPLPPGLVPVLDLTAVGRTPLKNLVMGGEWAACKGCQELMGIEPGAQGVDLEMVRRRHQEEVDRYFRKADRRDLRPLFRSQVYGGGNTDG